MTESTLPDSRLSGAELDAPDDERHAGRNRLVINILIVSAFVVILNETIMGVALPHLMADFSITANAAQWLTTAFMLTMAVVIPITGFLIQRFTTRQVFIAAMALFSLGTLVAAAAPGFEVLLVARVVQALGTAIMMPLLMTTVMTLVPAQTRGRTMGNISIVISVAPAIGPTISGLILSALSWRFMFILVLPIAIAALVIGAMRIKNVTVPRQVPIDVLSIVLSAFAFGGLVFGLSSMGESANGGMPGWIPLVVGGVALAAFIVRQLVLQRQDRALLDLRTFTARTFTVSVLMFAISMMALFGTIILLPLYMQEVLHLDTLASGLLLLPGGLLMGLLSPVVGRLYDRFGPRPLLVPGSIVLSGVLWSLTQVSPTTPWWAVLLAHIGLSAALAFMFTPLFTASLGSLRPSLYSHGSAVVGTVQQVAGAAGTALFISVMSAVAASQVASGTDAVAAQASGITTAFTYGAVISLFGIVAAFFVRRPADSGAPAMGH
ncbi:DHA2 family efflux MFS transporter permease subunit [Cnuibacter physcomitrellae]|uniref:MDR family MFS transporter n=1 Tax=Cnuibacter physcomitrellae TaxID=1619308 RepID=UPI002175770F|nr:MDR family MFS transporter [Cnuibacter physcomitrellae]MCS5496323.1 DHA2 family efflux MFS transporter permease subunit [Cnuibacter physcomitrellae]